MLSPKKLAERLNLTPITTRQAVELTHWQGGRFDLEMRLKKASATLDSLKNSPTGGTDIPCTRSCWIKTKAREGRSSKNEKTQQK